MSAPANVTADRADRVSVGQFVHSAPFTLTDATPDDGWLQVNEVSVSAGAVTFGLSDESVLVAAPDRLLRVGWS